MEWLSRGEMVAVALCGTGRAEREGRGEGNVSLVDNYWNVQKVLHTLQELLSVL